MIKIDNPLDETQSLEFEREEQLNDWLMQNYIRVVNELAEATGKKATLVKLLNDQCKDTQATGTVKVRGDVFEASIVRGVTPKYDVLDKKATPILEQMYTVIEEAREHIRVSFDERVAAMGEWIEEIESNDFKEFSPEEVELIKKFISVRRLQSTSPQVKIKQIGESPEGEAFVTNI